MPTQRVSLAKDAPLLSGVEALPQLGVMAQTVRKPMFQLTVADGASGGYLAAARACRKEFSTLAETLLERCGLQKP